MKLVVVFVFLFAVFLASYSFAGVSTQKATCKFKTEDVGNIVGSGSTPEKAFEHAVTECFERRKSLFNTVRNGSAYGNPDLIDEDPGLLYIDLCVNMSCQ